MLESTNTLDSIHRAFNGDIYMKSKLIK